MMKTVFLSKDFVKLARDHPKFGKKRGLIELWEAGIYKPRVDTIITVVDYAGVEITTLFKKERHAKNNDQRTQGKDRGTGKGKGGASQAGRER